MSSGRTRQSARSTCSGDVDSGDVHSSRETTDETQEQVAYRTWIRNEGQYKHLQVEVMFGYLQCAALFLQFPRVHREWIESRLQIVGDLLSEDVRFGKVFGVFKALVLEPEDVEVHLVTLDEFLVVE